MGKATKSVRGKSRVGATAPYISVFDTVLSCRTPYGINPKCNGHVTPGGKHVRCSPCEDQLAKESTVAKLAMDAFSHIPIAHTLAQMVERRWSVNLNTCRVKRG